MSQYRFWNAELAREIHLECDRQTLTQFQAKPHWFCREHMAVTKLHDNGTRSVCGVCGSPRIQYCPALVLSDPAPISLSHTK